MRRATKQRLNEGTEFKSLRTGAGAAHNGVGVGQSDADVILLAGTKEIGFEQDCNNKIGKNYTQNRISETGSQISKLETRSDSQNKIGGNKIGFRLG